AVPVGGGVGLGPVLAAPLVAGAGAPAGGGVVPDPVAAPARGGAGAAGLAGAVGVAAGLAGAVLAASGGGPAGDGERVVAADERGGLLGLVVVAEPHESGGRGASDERGRVVAQVAEQQGQRDALLLARACQGLH